MVFNVRPVKPLSIQIQNTLQLGALVSELYNCNPTPTGGAKRDCSAFNVARGKWGHVSPVASS